MPVYYPDEYESLTPLLVQQARLVFSDLHLVQNGIPGSKANYDAVGTILEKIIPTGGAPVLLVLWTQHPDEVDQLKNHLRERYAADKQPLAILPLPKMRFEGDEPEDLPSAIANLLESMPAIRALIHWERDVSEAADQCARTLYNLARAENKDIQQDLEILLSALARAATGKKIAQENPGESIHEALLPLLADQISNLSSSESSRDLWKAALPTAAEGKKISTSEAHAAAINSNLHIAGRDQSLAGTIRGAVIPVDDALIRSLFEKESDELLADFCLQRGAVVTWRGIQVEAACDYAQQKSPMIPFVLALEAAASLEFTKREMRPASIWFSPLLQAPAGEIFYLVANVKFAFSLPSSHVKTRVADYRLRESLISEVGFAKSQHSIRPGSITLGGKP